MKQFYINTNKDMIVKQQLLHKLLATDKITLSNCHVILHFANLIRLGIIKRDYQNKDIEYNENFNRIMI